MTSRSTPYPADTRAKGWRFEIDYEKVDQSDTWDLAQEIPMAQATLLMMWLSAWRQEPCGSLPNDEDIIRAKCKVPPKLWATMRGVLMRGWWLAEDGRLYHDTIVSRVLEMLEYRRKEAERRNRNRIKPPVVTPLSRGTDAGQPQDDIGTPDTGTGTGTLSSSPLRSGEDGARGESTTAGEICMAMKAAGLATVSPFNQTLLSLIAAGITQAEFVDAAKDAVRVQKPFAYALAVAAGRRRDAAAAVASLTAGAAPAKRRPTSHSGLAEKDYSAGVTADGSFV